MRERTEILFADTSFYVALLSSGDQLHGHAEALSREHRGEVVTTEFVLIEVGARLRKSEKNRRNFLALWRQLEADEGTRIVPASKELVARGRELYGERPDKEWTLTDCTSFIIMRDEGLTHALTEDHEFEQAGFVAMLRSS